MVCCIQVFVIVALFFWPLHKITISSFYRGIAIICVMPFNAFHNNMLFNFPWLILPFLFFLSTLTRVHYTEYLCTLVFRHSIEPVSILEIGELKQVFTRANHFMPKQRPGEYEFQYKKRLSQVSFDMFFGKDWL